MKKGLKLLLVALVATCTVATSSVVARASVSTTLSAGGVNGSATLSGGGFVTVGIPYGTASRPTSLTAVTTTTYGSSVHANIVFVKIDYTKSKRTNYASTQSGNTALKQGTTTVSVSQGSGADYVFLEANSYHKLSVGNAYSEKNLSESY